MPDAEGRPYAAAAGQAWMPLTLKSVGARLGLVVPKRLACRAVTRNLVKRQARVAFGRHQPALPAGDWVLRLRAPIDPRQHRSAASDALRAVLRDELAGLFARWPVQPPAGSAALGGPAGPVDREPA